MNKSTRNFIVGSVTVVTLVLCTGLFAFYNGGTTFLSAVQGPSELAYMPADATGVAYANVRDVMNSEFRQKLNQLIPTGEGRDEFLRETGIDIERDIDTVVAAVSIDQEEAVVVVRGRFNEGQIESLLRQHGGDTEQYNGIRIVSSAKPDAVMPRDGQSESLALAFLESGLLAVGSTSSVKRAIDAKESGQNATKNGELMTYVNDIRAGQSAWAVGRFDAVQKTTEIPDQIREHLPAVKWFAVTTRINGGITGSIRADTADDLAAENLRDVVRGGLAMGRLVSGQDQNMKMLLDSLQMSGTGKTVALSFSVSPEMLNAITGLATMSGMVEPGASIR